MSDAPLCYAFDPVTGLSLGAIPADPSPLEEGVWLYPAYTALDAPPAAEAGHAVLRQGDAWAQVPDHRGETWWDADGRAVVVTSVGDPASSGLSVDRPASPPEPAPYLTGKDIVDGMSRVQANDPAVDQRDLVRIGAAPRASEVKGCIARIEKDLKLAAGTLTGQSTASGGR